jgi:hypothetical protein
VSNNATGIRHSQLIVSMDTLSFKKLIIKSKNNNNKNNTLTRIKSVKQHYNTQNKIKIQIKSVKQHYDTQTQKKAKKQPQSVKQHYKALTQSLYKNINKINWARPNGPIQLKGKKPKQTHLPTQTTQSPQKRKNNNTPTQTYYSHKVKKKKNIKNKYISTHTKPTWTHHIITPNHTTNQKTNNTNIKPKQKHTSPKTSQQKINTAASTSNGPRPPGLGHNKHMDIPTHTNNNKRYHETINKYPQNMVPSKKYISKNDKIITIIPSYHTSKNHAHSHNYTTRRNLTIIHNNLSWSYTTRSIQNIHLQTPTNITSKFLKPKVASQIKNNNNNKTQYQNNHITKLKQARPTGLAHKSRIKGKRIKYIIKTYKSIQNKPSTILTKRHKININDINLQTHIQTNKRQPKNLTNSKTNKTLTPHNINKTK